jgi:hypothetical protein
MTFKKKTRQDWRCWLTQEELAVISRVDAAKEAWRKLDMDSDVYRIRNNAIARRRQAMGLRKR